MASGGRRKRSRFTLDVNFESDVAICRATSGRPRLDHATWGGPARQQAIFNFAFRAGRDDGWFRVQFGCCCGGSAENWIVLGQCRSAVCLGLSWSLYMVLAGHVLLCLYPLIKSYETWSYISTVQVCFLVTTTPAIYNYKYNTNCIHAFRFGEL